jgi:hypothetical protein
MLEVIYRDAIIFLEILLKMVSLQAACTLHMHMRTVGFFLGCFSHYFVMHIPALYSPNTRDKKG